MARLEFRCRQRLDGFTLDASFASDALVTGIFGPSGAGKSTILETVAGLRSPDEGLIRVGTRTLLDTAQGIALAPERRRVGLVAQDQLLFPHLTVAANLRFGMRRGVAARLAFERVIDLLELGPLLDRLPRTLSGGQRQRTALGRAVLSGPDLLLMDEPLTALDERLKERILADLDRLVHEAGIPALFVSHDQADVRRLAETVVVIDGGSVAAIGPSAETLDGLGRAGGWATERPVTILRLEDVRQEGTHWEGRLGGAWLHLPFAPEAGWSGFVRLLPTDVVLSRGTVAGVSVRNQLPGTVRDVAVVGFLAFVAVDVGQVLWAEVTTDAVRELDLTPGRPVTCLVKTSALHPMA